MSFFRKKSKAVEKPGKSAPPPTPAPALSSKLPSSPVSPPAKKVVAATSPVSPAAPKPVDPATQTASPVFATQSRRGTASASRSGGGAEVEPAGINPAEVLINRLEAWKGLLKLLKAYFNEIAELESQTSKSYGKAAGLIQIPLKETGHHFKGEQGIQDLFVAFRDGSRQVANDHNEFATFVTENVVSMLIQIKKDIKERVRNIQKDDKYQTDVLSKEKEASKKAIANLQKLCVAAQITPDAVSEKHDPWLANVAVINQMKRQLKEENRLHECMLALQHEIATFEGSVIDSLKTTIRTFYDWRAKDLDGYRANSAAVWTALGNLQQDTEWQHFHQKYQDQLIKENAKFKEYSEIDYPSKDSPLVQAVKQGRLERKGNLKGWNDHYYVLTPVGYLHEFKTADDTTDPDVSVFIPNTTISGVTSVKGTKPGYSFEIRGRNAAGLLNRERNFVFKASSQTEMSDWNTKLLEISSKPLTPQVVASPPSSPVDTKSPVDAKSPPASGAPASSPLPPPPAYSPPERTEKDPAPSTSTSPPAPKDAVPPSSGGEPAPASAPPAPPAAEASAPEVSASETEKPKVVESQ